MSIHAEAGVGPLSPARRGTGARSVLRASAAIVVLLLIWQFLPTSGLVNEFLVPPPTQVAAQLVDLAGPHGAPPYGLWSHIGWSVARLLVGVALGALCGIPLGICMALNRVVDLAMRPILTVVLSVPSLALTPILVLMIGLNNKVAVIVIAIEATVVMAYNAQLGAASVSEHMKWAMASLGANGMGIFTKVVLPGSLPSLVTATKLSVGYGWRALIAVESIAATAHGLGFMIFQAQSFMNTRTIYAGIVAIAIVGFALERVLFGRVERKINAWYAIEVEER